MENKKLEWYVYCLETCYSGKPKMLLRNIFELNWPMNAVLYKLRNYKNKMKFAKELDSLIAWQLWSRSEYECYINNELKIDPYQQIQMNWDKFVDYCWENKKLFGSKSFKESNKHWKEVQEYWRKYNKCEI